MALVVAGALLAAGCRQGAASRSETGSGGPPARPMVTRIDEAALEQEVSAYGYYLRMLPLDEARSSLMAYYADISRRDSLEFDTLVRLVEKYLYDPASPFCDEDLFQPFAAALAAAERLPVSDRDRYAFIADRSAMNATGTRAADFTFTDASGVRHRLSDYRSDYLLVIFGDPACTACRDLRAALSGSEGVTALLASGRLTLIEVSREEDIAAAPYHIRAMPSAYLLDASRTVLLRDPDPSRLLARLGAL